MAFWWVNHKQTVRQETEGGYIWSPKHNANGAKNVTYDNLARCQVGDVVFSYAYAKIGRIGLVASAAETAPKPPEFGITGEYWGDNGWLVRVAWQPLQQPLVPLDHFDLIQPLLPKRHSPINTTSGRGNQGVYLAELDEVLGHLLIQLIEVHADPAIKVHLLVLAEEQTSVDALFKDVQELQQVPSATERDALTKARLGQGLFRQRVAEQEPICRVTGLARQEFLIASHIKPWRDCDHQERLDGANGLLLSPHIDKLFDRHWISFDRDGKLIWQHEAAGDALQCWGITSANVIRPFSRKQEEYLQLHREYLR